MRRYWHPVAVSTKVNSIPQRVRILGEDLILFRDKKARPGLLTPRCAHRGTSLPGQDLQRVITTDAGRQEREGADHAALGRTSGIERPGDRYSSPSAEGADS